MKKLFALLCALTVLCCCVPALAGGYVVQDQSTLLRSLEHNCPNTGVMLPAQFSPYQTTYLLTVASWVSRPTFTPTAMDPNAVIYVNGQIVRSGQTSQVIPMTDQPQAVTIEVRNGGESTQYTIYLQRRPSEKRTRVSAGFIQNIYLKGTTWHIDADLVTIKYNSDDYDAGSLSTYNNGSVDHYDYAVSPHCIFYFGTKNNCFRATNIYTFQNNYKQYGSTLYTIVYIESEIVAVLPYGADY